MNRWSFPVLVQLGLTAVIVALMTHLVVFFAMFAVGVISHFFGG